MKRLWRVGNALNPQDNDRSFDDELDAIRMAEAMARPAWSTPVAVWDDRDDIVHLFLCGDQFKRVS